MTLRQKALGVHLLTGTGAVFAMLAMLAAVDQEWSLISDFFPSDAEVVDALIAALKEIKAETDILG